MNNSCIKIAIADDNKFFTEALKDSLQQHNEFKIIATLHSINDVIQFTQNNPLDILILDVNFKGENSLNYISEIKKHNSLLKIMILTTLNNNFIRQEAKEKEIDFFIGKDTDFSTFKNKISACFYTSPTRKKAKKTCKIRVNNLVFTKRKLAVLQTLYTHSEKNGKALAQLLKINEATLKSHKRELFEITNTKNTSELIKFGIKNGLILV